MLRSTPFRLVCCLFLALTTSALFAEDEEGDPPEATIGERLFLETRFAQFFFANCNGDVNAVLAKGDPVVETLQTLNGPIPSPFTGKTMNCRQCHLVDDARDIPGGGERTYSDFARRSPIPIREDGHTLTTRNSPALVNAQLPRKGGFFLHFDAEFEDAVNFYVRFSQLLRDGKVRNGDDEIGRISITPDDAALLAKFLRSLNEDYQ